MTTMTTPALTTDPRKILIVKPSSLGDIVHSLPFLNAIKTRFPRAGIHWVIAGGLEELLEGHSMIDRLWVIHKDAWKKIRNMKETVGELKNLFRELKMEEFDLVIDLQGLLRSGVITAATGAPIRIGFKEAREGSRLFYTHSVEGGKDMHAVDRYLKIADFLGCDVSRVVFPLPDFTNEFISMHSQLSFPRAKRVGNPSDSPLEKEDKGGCLQERFRTSRNDRLTTESDFSNNHPRSSPSSFILHPSSFDSPLSFEEYAVLVPGSRWETKIWPPENFGKLAALLPFNAVIAGSGNDAAIADVIVALSEGKAVSLAGKTNLKELVEIMRKARFVVSNDSGPMHIAAALGVPVFAVFGPTDPLRTGPYGKGHTIIRADVSCAPCFRKKCDDMKCMKSLSVEKVYSEIKSRL
jgi:ADP-heptose:LPS heptosyltransferase